MDAAAAVRKIPLDKLVLSPSNVRKTPASAAEDAELKASLKAHGLKQNLIVHALPGEKGVFAVIAGGRRLKALQELAAEGVIPPDYKVPCLVEALNEAIETSLAENVVRAAMSPADEFAAMAALIEAGQPAEAVARRFGVTERHVRQRLRLGNAAPELLDEFRAGALSLDMLTAFTLSSDHAAQLAVWHQVKDRPYGGPQEVRRLLTQSAISTDSRLGVFVGVAAYEAAGGTVTRDLFSAGEDGFLDDAGLVRRLAIEKLEAKAVELRPDWAWVKAILDPDYGFAAQFRRLAPEPPELPPDITREMDSIVARLDALENAEDWDDELAEEAERLEARQQELAQIAEEAQFYSAENRAISGCIVTVDHDGNLRIHKGLSDRQVQRREPLDPSSAPGRERSSDGGGGAVENPGEVEDAVNADEPDASSPAAAQTGRAECGFTQALLDDLKAHRLQITKAHLAADFGVAFDLALYTLCCDLLHPGCRSRPLDLKASDTTPRSSLNDLTGAPADRLLQVHEQALDLDWLSLPPADGFEALSALPADAKQRLFAWCIAACLNGQLAIEPRADPVLERAGERLAIPLADYWRPSAANYWGRVKKAHGLAVAAELLGPRWARDHADDKKGVLAAALERAFNPAANAAVIGLDWAVRDAASAWLPPGMAYAAGVPDIDNGTDKPAGDEASPELPAFLTDGGANGAGLNGAHAPCARAKGQRKAG